ncbi:ATP-dependent helicase/nuclease subunit B [Limibacillus sp. MBR-115]
MTPETFPSFSDRDDMSDEKTRPNVFTLPPEQPFADTLALGLSARFAKHPERLADVLLLLPTRRACRSLQEAFLRVSENRPRLLPRLLPLGDLDEEELTLTDPLGLDPEAETTLPPAMSPLARQFHLARLVARWRAGIAGGGQSGGSDAQDLMLAAELGRLLDQVETEGLDFSRLSQLVPEEHADHWQATLRFLEIVTQFWPEIEKEAGSIGAAARRRRLLEWQAKAWRRNPPRHPVIAAGSTGSIPATADLLSVIQGLPEGEVVLPGLDIDCEAETWETISKDPSHPQFGMAKLLKGLGVARTDVQVWNGASVGGEPYGRSQVVNLSLSPAELTHRWIDKGVRFEAENVGRAFTRVQRIDCPGLREEAIVAALALRQVLEEEGRTAALVTPDRDLARRVAVELDRWGIKIDDSAGRPLGGTPVGAYLRLVGRLLAEGPSPLLLLAVLKHPRAAAGMAPAGFRKRVRSFERLVLRGPLPAASLPQLKGLLDDALALAIAEGGEKEIAELRKLETWFAGLCKLLEPIQRVRPAKQPLELLLKDHTALAEALARSDDLSGPDQLWKGDDGEVAATFLRQMLEAAHLYGEVRVRDYAEVFDTLLQGQTVRPRYGLHPRLFIWGPMEARLQRADRLILGGLNEGTWPGDADPGPWMSRPMRAAFGLPSADQSIGLSAHDFAQAMNASEVFLTRSERVGGTPTVPSRWLLRLDTLLAALDVPADLLTRDAAQWLNWAEALDAPESVTPAPPPAPRPPAERRPRKASVTAIERWLRDPYAFYAGSVLGLRKLDDLDAEPGAAERGTLIHELLEGFTRDYPKALPENVEAELEQRMGLLLDKLQRRPALAAYWEPRLQRILEWVVEQEKQRRSATLGIHAELRGSLELKEADGFSLYGKADRIETLKNGSLAILDYKTGTPPNKKEVLEGRAPQLLLEAIMAEADGFAGLQGQKVEELAYWHLSGGGTKGSETSIPIDEALVAETRQRLVSFVLAYADPDSPFLARPRPGFDLRFNDYAHLARIKEWAADGGEG